MIIEYHKLTKINEPSYIYLSHIRNINNDIYLDSISVEYVNHTFHYVIMQTNNITHY
jgi:hypothetical protein